MTPINALLGILAGVLAVLFLVSLLTYRNRPASEPIEHFKDGGPE